MASESMTDRDWIAMGAPAGFADGWSGRAPAGQSPQYEAAYRRGQLLVSVESGGIMLSAYQACECPRCAAQFFGETADCGCEEPGPRMMIHGHLVMSGPDPMNSGFCFMSNTEIRALIGTGMRLVDLDGADISCQIHPPQ